jgi:hypothetical protein
MVTIDRLLVGEGGFDLDFRIIRNRIHKPVPTNPYRRICVWGWIKVDRVSRIIRSYPPFSSGSTAISPRLAPDRFSSSHRSE